MLERVRFTRYALRFEEAFKTDDWEPVKECFEPDAVYSISGTPEYTGDHRGRDAIAAIFKRMMDEFDRRFDSRKPGPAGWPHVKSGVFILPWKVRYTLGDRSAVLRGTSHCTFSGGKIRELRDTANADDWAERRALLAPR